MTCEKIEILSRVATREHFLSVLRHEEKKLTELFSELKAVVKHVHVLCGQKLNTFLLDLCFEFTDEVNDYIDQLRAFMAFMYNSSTLEDVYYTVNKTKHLYKSLKLHKNNIDSIRQKVNIYDWAITTLSCSS